MKEHYRAGDRVASNICGYYLTLQMVDDALPSDYISKNCSAHFSV